MFIVKVARRRLLVMAWVRHRWFGEHLVFMGFVMVNPCGSLSWGIAQIHVVYTSVLQHGWVLTPEGKEIMVLSIVNLSWELLVITIHLFLQLPTLLRWDGSASFERRQFRWFGGQRPPESPWIKDLICFPVKSSEELSVPTFCVWDVQSFTRHLVLPTPFNIMQVLVTIWIETIFSWLISFVVFVDVWAHWPLGSDLTRDLVCLFESVFFNDWLHIFRDFWRSIYLVQALRSVEIRASLDLGWSGPVSSFIRIVKPTIPRRLGVSEIGRGELIYFLWRLHRLRVEFNPHIFV
jgi:hypothetical protein